MLNRNDDAPPVLRPRGRKPIRVDPSQILDAAQCVFAQNGVDGSSIRAIAKEAKCDPSLLYYHFKNKEAIFAAILERKFSRFMPDLESIATTYGTQMNGKAQADFRNADGHTPMQEALWQTLQVFHRHIKDDAGFRDMIRGNVAVHQTFAQNEMLKYVSQMMRIIREYLSKGIESGELRSDMNLDTATFFFIRTSIEIQDFLPIFATKLLPMPLDEVIDLAEKEWFQLFWTGIKNGSRQIAAKESKAPKNPSKDNSAGQKMMQGTPKVSALAKTPPCQSAAKPKRANP